MTRDVTFDFAGLFGAAEEPAEPNWKELEQLLLQTEKWLRYSDSSDGLPGCIEIAEATGLLLEMLQDFESSDARVKAFVSKIEWAAFWIYGKTDDPHLAERVARLCETGDEIMAGIVKATKESAVQLGLH